MKSAMTLKQRIEGVLWLALESAGFFGSLFGAAVVAFLGKLMLAVVLGAVSLGFFLRLSGRRSGPPPAPAPMPAWCYLVAWLASLVEVAVLTEATDLPVRFYQPGFEPWHWALVIAALYVASTVQLQVLRSFMRRPRVASEP